MRTLFDIENIDFSGIQINSPATQRAIEDLSKCIGCPLPCELVLMLSTFDGFAGDSDASLIRIWSADEMMRNGISKHESHITLTIADFYIDAWRFYMRFDTEWNQGIFLCESHQPQPKFPDLNSFIRATTMKHDALFETLIISA
jgi:hypothetical protein